MSCFFGHKGEWVDAELEATFHPGVLSQSLGSRTWYEQGQKRTCERCGLVQIRRVSVCT